MGQGNALWMIETGIRIDAQRAMAIGLVQEVVPAGAALARTRELADRIAGYPQASLRTDRAATLATYGLSVDAGLYMESGLGRPAATDPEMLDGLRNFIAGNRPEAPRPT
jgi:enoyl-CoA hydratase